MPEVNAVDMAPKLAKSRLLVQAGQIPDCQASGRTAVSVSDVAKKYGDLPDWEIFGTKPVRDPPSIIYGDLFPLALRGKSKTLGQRDERKPSFFPFPVSISQSQNDCVHEENS